MAGPKIAAARLAAAAFVEAMTLEPGRDQVGVVRFDIEAELTHPLSSNSASVQAAIAGLESRLGTRMDLGLDVALAEQRSPRRVEGNDPVVILLTDGMQTSGPPDAHFAASARVRGAGVILYAIGLGADVDQATLIAMAGDTSRYRFAPDESALAAIYAEVARVIQCPTNELWP
jgi:Mg-chelatase subunit ChlD